MGQGSEIEMLLTGWMRWKEKSWHRVPHSFKCGQN
jgi:hypothetical protein